MRPAFYNNPEYKKKQSLRTRQLWAAGRYHLLSRPLEVRKCKNSKCSKNFHVKSYSPNVYCSHSCAAMVSNSNRILSQQTKQKIAVALTGRKNPNHPNSKPRIELVCQNYICEKPFKVLPYLAKRQKFCSIHCSIQTTGRLTTSPKAAKSKPGIRLDVSPEVCFYSTWEANIARVFNLVRINWQYAPKIFDLGEHTYRPDFYLPDGEIFIEVKNFMGEYSLKRDQLFRQKYPNIRLEILSRTEYEKIEENYSALIEGWEQ